MNKKERLILRSVVRTKYSPLSPDTLIENIAGKDKRAIENLVIGGYIEEVPRDVAGPRGTRRIINFYRATEKGLIKFKPFYKKWWYSMKTETALWIGIITILIATGSIIITSMSYIASVNEDKILNRPYIAVDPSGLDELNISKVKSDLDDFSEQLIEKQVRFIIENTGQSPAAFQVDLTELKEVGVVEIIPQKNTEGVIFPDESKEVEYLLEIHSSFPSTDLEKKEQEQYLKKMQSVIAGDMEYLSRIIITYDYLDKKSEGKYKTFIDQKFPKLNFSENNSGRIDGYGSTWIVSFDSE